MQTDVTTDLQLDSYIYDGDFELNCRTPDLPTFDSLGGTPEPPGRSDGNDRQSPESSGQGCVLPLHYTITWKLQLRKGRLSTLTEDTIESLEAAPSAYWNETLRDELMRVVSNKVPEPQYVPDETRITVSTSKRAVSSFQKRFDELNITWDVVENKLRSWSGPQQKLTVAVWFIFKENPSVPSTNTSKVGRGAIRKQFAARNELIAQQEMSGTRPVWKDVYALFECSSVECPNRGFSCLRDPKTKKHRKMDSDIMDRLVDHAEEGHPLNTHNDVPSDIQDRIYKHEEEDAARRKRKRNPSDTPPINIRLCCQGRHEDAADPTGDRRDERGAKLKLPMRRDEAAVSYCDWLCAQVSNRTWMDGYRLACKVTLEQGYDLERLFMAQDMETKMLMANGVKRGIALQFVGRVQEWLEDIS